MIWNCLRSCRRAGSESWGGLIAPQMFVKSRQGRPLIAQHFSAGETMAKRLSPVGTAECFGRPYGTRIFLAQFPTLKCWAIFAPSLRDRKNLQLFKMTYPAAIAWNPAPVARSRSRVLRNRGRDARFLGRESRIPSRDLRIPAWDVRNRGRESHNPARDLRIPGRDGHIPSRESQIPGRDGHNRA